MKDELASKTRLVSFHLSAGDHQGLDRRSVSTHSSLHPHRCVLFLLIMLALFSFFHLTPLRTLLRSVSDQNKVEQKFKTLRERRM